MELPVVDRIWRIRGKLALDPAESPADAFDKLDDLFQTSGTTYQVNHDTLTFRKRAPLAQDKMATFSRGTLRVTEDDEGRQLAYDLVSHALFYCFLAPFFFLAIAGLIKESRTPAYVFTGMFCIVYIAGRILEPWLIRNAFRKRLSGVWKADHETTRAA